MIEKIIKEKIVDALARKGIGFTEKDITIDIPKQEDHGDYASNAAFLLAKSMKKSPHSVADELSPVISEECGNLFDAVNVNGFINFRLSDSLIYNEITSINADYGKTGLGEGRQILLEFVSANPTGPLHIGHGRWAAIGDSLARILLETGHKVATEFYINDAGNQITNFRASVEAAKKGQPIPENGYHGKYIYELTGSNADPVELMIADQKQVLGKFGCIFDNWFSESSLFSSHKVQQAIDYLKGKNVTYEKDGALWLQSSSLGDDKDRVLIRENGEPTYFASDIAYHFDKFGRKIDEVIDIWGADHHGYVQRIKAALKIYLGQENVDERFSVIIGQMVRLFRDNAEVKMSKRTGEMITLREVMEEIGVDATRYFLLVKSADQVLDFNMDLALKQSNDNPVFYVQYAHARICSILRKAGTYKTSSMPERKLENEERKLILKLIRFPRTINRAAVERTPYLIPQYLEELAVTFHAFYHKCKVISEDQVMTGQRLMFVDKVRLIIEKGLNLMGVSAPESM